MKVVTLASSSKGNCVLFYTLNSAILIDMGMCLDECEAKLNALGLHPSQITGILNTHCHGDHTKGIGAFVRKYGTRVFVHAEGRDALLKKMGKVNQTLVTSISELPFELGDFTIKAFKLPHDAPCCVGYNLVADGNKVSYATDLGYITPEILDNLIGSSLVVLESNHDKQTLIANPNYTPVLKARILSDHGHLSNDVAASVVFKLATTGTRQVILAHLSEENNTPEICYNTITKYLSDKGIAEGTHIRIDVAPAKKIGTVFKLK